MNLLPDITYTDKNTAWYYRELKFTTEKVKKYIKNRQMFIWGNLFLENFFLNGKYNISLFTYILFTFIWNKWCIRP